MSTGNEINYLLGDATRPIGPGHKVVAHVCNNTGGWGAGFVLALSARWRAPELAYKEWAAGRWPDFCLGGVLMVPVSKRGAGITVANMIAQDNSGAVPAGQPLVQYEALVEGFSRLYNFISLNLLGASVHMPRIGVGLGGGDWAIIESIIQHGLVEKGLRVTVYDRPASMKKQLGQTIPSIKR